MTGKRRFRWRVGEVIAIPLGDDWLGFGLVLADPLMAFFDRRGKVGAAPPVEEIVRSPAAFRIWVMHRPIKDGSWPILGRVSVPVDLLELPWFSKRDALSGEVTITRTGAEEILPEPGQAETLECAAVWSANHVVDRLRDHFDGRPNRWVESMKLPPYAAVVTSSRGAFATTPPTRQGDV